MDRAWFLTNLKLAKTELEDLIAEIEAEPDSGLAEAVALAQIGSIYSQLNYAWNTRNTGNEKIEGAVYEQAIKFPTELDL